MYNIKLLSSALLLCNSGLERLDVRHGMITQSMFRQINILITQTTPYITYYLLLKSFVVGRFCNKNKKPSYCWDSQPSVAIFRT